ncbi:uncharacterized protein E0L32_010339 [Thyridium curvatum]|uniref:VOC domain-containing protein n=1 Tax=Thyridium curvatum TaxID=1093900 RepID=A0A507AT12_9PEZI|nr:uncharacterized protein E0L32_010339 [Thyridium curvatum]TPX08008.1 hypothetical protein E0L32_010339 [Thyridium curvatum]
MNHIAISVPDLEAAIKFYTEILGFVEVRPASFTERAASPDASIFKIYPASLQSVKVAYLTTGNGCGIELFQFMAPRSGADDNNNFERDYFKGGLFHYCVTIRNPTEMCEAIVKAGGRKIGDDVDLHSGNKAIYAADPWGNVIELLSCSFERLMANR